MATVAHGNNLAYLNATGGDVVLSPNGPGVRTAIGNFDWNFHGQGNAFAWADLEVGNTMTWRFNEVGGQTLGLLDPNTFQFVSWTGTNWAIVNLPVSQLSFTASGDFGFSAVVTSVIPLPAGAAMAGLGLGVLPLVRRRRTA